MQQIRKLIETLNKATEAYNNGTPIMTDNNWDTLYYQLVDLEAKTGIHYSDSPTNSVKDFSTLNVLEKRRHNHLMLSLDKTKNLSEIKAFCQKNSCLAMLKMDGLTCSLHYNHGKLISGETRGDGEVGEDITNNIKWVKNVPITIADENDLIIDGEIICSYQDFEAFSNGYQNPRNFAAGSIRLLSSKESSERPLQFVAWDVITSIADTLSEKLDYIEKLGFTIVPKVEVNGGLIEEVINILKDENTTYPIDGIVFKYNNCHFYDTCGRTSHHFKGGLAYKFYDEEYPTLLRDIEWGMGRTGVLTPVAIFDPIDIEGSVVERASLHNVSVLKETLGDNPFKTQNIIVSKRNMIIPQVEWADKDNPPFDLNNIIPMIEKCPVCGEPVQFITENDSTICVCSNPACEGKFLNHLDYFCGKKGLDIKGLSLATLEKLIDWGWINSLKDIFLLKDHREEWIKKEGFGVASVDKILAAIETARTTTLEKFISALGIPLIGPSIAKKLCESLTDFNDFINKVENNFSFSSLPGFGYEREQAIFYYDFSDAIKVAEFLIFISETEEKGSKLKGMSFVVTGKLQNYKNRAELQKTIELNGGKLVGSISKNVNYLINNDLESTSTKNKEAKKLNIPIISEKDFQNLLTF